jgi:hypothetical protein
VGKVVQHLQSVNCHDSHAHGHERHGPFTRLVGFLVGMVWVGSSWSGLWYAVTPTFYKNNFFPHSSAYKMHINL